MRGSAAYGGAFRRRLEPASGAALGVALAVAAVLLANGRPIGAGDTRPTERVAASLVGELDFDLDEYPEVTPPFARDVGGHRVSIYPVLSALLAAPVFAAAGWLFALDETGTALAGKLAAVLLSSLAAGALFLAVGRRQLPGDALRAALLFALGTSVWSTSQALWQHPAAVLFLCLAVLALVRAEEEPVWAGRAGLPLGLAVAARHADLPLGMALAAGTALRWPRRLPALLMWAAAPTLGVLAYQWRYFGSPLGHGFSGSLLERFDAPWGVGHLGLLLSPAKGLLVFTPLAAIAALGWWHALRRPLDRPLAATLGAGVLVHWLVMGRWSEWHGGECWGPRMMTDALPLLFFYLPEGLERARGVGTALAALSVSVQALGAFAYDYRWERLHQRPAESDAVLWRVGSSPIPFHVRERVVILALPGVHGGHAQVHRHPVVVLGASGNRVDFAGGELLVSGDPATFGDVHLQRRAFAADGVAKLRGRWAGLFLRATSAGRARPLVLRVTGRGQGTLYVGESTFWSRAPRWTAYPMSGGSFDIRHPYHHPDSGGGDLLITLGRARGQADLESVTLD